MPDKVLLNIFVDSSVVIGVEARPKAGPQWLHEIPRRLAGFRVPGGV